MVKHRLRRGAMIVLIHAGVAALSVRSNAAADTVPRLADRSHLLHPESAAAALSNGAKIGGSSNGHITFDGVRLLLTGCHRRRVLALVFQHSNVRGFELPRCIPFLPFLTGEWCPGPSQF
jgi:hypothetical protein